MENLWGCDHKRMDVAGLDRNPKSAFGYPVCACADDLTGDQRIFLL